MRLTAVRRLTPAPGVAGSLLAPQGKRRDDDQEALRLSISSLSASTSLPGTSFCIARSGLALKIKARTMRLRHQVNAGYCHRKVPEHNACLLTMRISVDV